MRAVRAVNRTPPVEPAASASKGASVGRTAWRRETDAQDVTSKLGQRLREHREEFGLSLTNASEATGIATATLSRIENNKMAPTFSLVLKIMAGLKISWHSLMDPSASKPLDGQVSFQLPGEEVKVDLQGYSFAPLHESSPLRRSMSPMMQEVTARSLRAAGGLAGHAGIEFCYVMSGTLVLHFAGRPPQELPVGGSALFNCELPHAYVAKTRAVTRILYVVSRDPLVGDLGNFPLRSEPPTAE